MTFSSDQIMAGCAVVTILGGIVALMLAQKDAAQELKLKALADTITAKDEAFKKELNQRDRDIDRLDANVKASWIIIDRLKDEKNQYWTREEHDKWRVEVKQELKEDIQEMGSRLSEKLTEVADKFGEKIADILKNCAKCRAD